jgi:ABC-type transporter Mla MlaB component
MLRIGTIEMESGARTLQLSGSISGAWVKELQDCCELLLSNGHLVTLDLSDVQYADVAGLELLSKLKSRNVSVVGSPLVARLLEAYGGQGTT